MKWYSEERLKYYFPILKNPIKISKIEKGFSGEEKFCITSGDSKKYLLRVQDLEMKEHTLNHFKVLEEIDSLDIPITRPIACVEMEEENKVGMLLTFLEGEDAEESLSSLSKEEQYTVGVAAGQILKKIHSYIHGPHQVSWYESKSAKHAKYEQGLRELENYYDTYQHVLKFITDHQYLMGGRPSCFLHDDFHPSNLIIHNKKFEGVIDFNRFEWGDPYHDFHKVALFSRNISVPFAIGQIHGYFDGDPDENFWQLYSLYVAMAVISSIVWTEKVIPHLIDDMIYRVNQILDDHQQFQFFTPTWYLSKNTMVTT